MNQSQRYHKGYLPLEYLPLECLPLEYLPLEYLPLEYLPLEYLALEYLILEYFSLEYLALEYLPLMDLECKVQDFYQVGYGVSNLWIQSYSYFINRMNIVICIKKQTKL